MIRNILIYLWRFFVVGFPSHPHECKHNYPEWSNAEFIKDYDTPFLYFFTNPNKFDVYIKQTRYCKICNNYSENIKKVSVLGHNKETK